MSSNVERAPKVGAQAGVEEAIVDFLLEQIGKRAPSPTQAAKVCRTLGLATRENIWRVREFAKNKTASDFVGRSPEPSRGAEAETENKKEEEKKVEVIEKGRLLKKIKRLAEGVFKKRFEKVEVTRYGIFCYSSKEAPSFNNEVEVRIRSSFTGLAPDLVENGEYHDINIFVYKPTYLAISKKFGNQYEELTGKKIFVLKEY